MRGTPKVVKDYFNRLCPKDWGKYDPRKPIYMEELNHGKEREEAEK